MRPHITCPACGEWKKATHHHVYPASLFGRGQRNNTICLLCWECHCELHTLIPQTQKMPRRFYTMILSAFIKEKGRVL